ncbi:MAG: hypothetical protein WCC58_03925 [Burkholderiales bacterium]
MKILKCVSIVLFFLPFATYADALDGGDVKMGKALVEKNCVACHARLFPGDAAKIYTRADRKVTTRAKLLAQIALCNSQLGTQWFPEDEVNAAAFLNQEYYKLPQDK